MQTPTHSRPATPAAAPAVPYLYTGTAKEEEHLGSSPGQGTEQLSSAQNTPQDSSSVHIPRGPASDREPFHLSTDPPTSSCFGSSPRQRKKFLGAVGGLFGFSMLFFTVTLGTLWGRRETDVSPAPADGKEGGMRLNCSSAVVLGDPSSVEKAFVPNHVETLREIPSVGVLIERLKGLLAQDAKSRDPLLVQVLKDCSVNIPQTALAAGGWRAHNATHGGLIEPLMIAACLAVPRSPDGTAAGEPVLAQLVRDGVFGGVSEDDRRMLNRSVLNPDGSYNERVSREQSSWLHKSNPAKQLFLSLHWSMCPGTFEELAKKYCKPPVTQRSFHELQAKSSTEQTRDFLRKQTNQYPSR